MKSEEFFEVIGDIDNDFIEESLNFKKKNSGKLFLKVGTMAACFAIITVISMQVLQKHSRENDNVIIKPEDDTSVVEVTPSDKETTEIENSPPTYVAEDNKTAEEPHSTDEALPEITVEDAENAVNEESIAQDTMRKETTEDSDSAAEFPVLGGGGVSSSGIYKEAVDTDSLTKNVSEIFGGAYIDGDGSYVVVITEDTRENRELIGKELGIDAEETVFKKGEYTLAYLTALQEKISAAMINGEIPFVVTSAVKEASNRIEVGVTTSDEAELNKVRLLDTAGGAIIFNYTSVSYDIMQSNTRE